MLSINQLIDALDEAISDKFIEEVFRQAILSDVEGIPLPTNPLIRIHDFGIRIGSGARGGAQTKVRVSMNPTSGRIHGTPFTK